MKDNIIAPVKLPGLYKKNMETINNQIDIKSAIDSYNEKRKLEGSEKMTITKLAEQIDFPSRKMETLRQDFCQFQKGLRNCPIKIVKQICEILGCSSDELLAITK